MIRRVLFLSLLCCALPAFAGGVQVTALSAAEVPALLKPPGHGERVIMLWALDCAYCEPNMQALARLQKAHHGEIELVTVDIDDIRTARAAIAKRLAAAGMQGYAARAYTALAPERMNFLIDPDWGGETPRTMVIRADGTRTAISGDLTPQQLRRIEPR